MNSTMRGLLSLFTCSILMVSINSCGNHNKSTSGMTTNMNMDMSGRELDLTGGKQGQTVGFVDVDGDGTLDKVVGAPYASVEPNAVGAVLVYQGMSTGFSPAPTMVLTGDDNLGYSFVNLSDVDGDGKADYAVGAIHGDGEDVSLSGSVIIYKGGGSGQVIKKLSGEWPMDKFGLALDAGDLNGDGSPDIVVGAPFNTNDPALYQSGSVYVFFGPDFTSSVALHASSNYKGLGWSVATGDVNGDAVADLALSGTGTTPPKVLIFYGGANFIASINANTPDFVFTSAASGFGKTIAVIGDINGAGGGEIAIGAPNAVVSLNTVSSRDVGRVFIVNVNGAAPIDLDTAISGAAGPLLTRLDGETLFSRFGSAITALGDIDGGGKPDFAVGAPMQNVDWNILSGTVYIFKGEDITAGNSWATASAFDGMVKDQAYGTALASALMTGPTGTMTAILIGAPRSNADTGGVAMIDPLTGQSVAGGSTGGSAGGDGSGECH